MSSTGRLDRDLRATRRTVLALIGGSLAACATRGAGRDIRGAQVQDRPDRRAVPLRLPARARIDVRGRITPLSYGGGFDAKTAIYETLVRMGPDGRLVPGLASAWSVEDGGRSFVFELRAGAFFHDGSPADAQAVQLHFRRWVGLPEHAWLESSDHVIAVEALSARELRVRLDEPRDLLGDLLSINPCAIAAPASVDRKGEFARALGSGPLRLVEVLDEGRIVRCEAVRSIAELGDDHPRLDFVTYTPADPRRPIDDLFAGRLDAVIDNWSESLPRRRAISARRDARFRVSRGPGGSVTFLAFRLASGPTASADVRRRIRASIDRGELIHAAEAGFAAPCASLAAPTIVDWPMAGEPDGSVHSGKLPKLRWIRSVEGGDDDGPDRLLHEELVRQFGRAGIEVELASLEASEFEAQLAQGRFDLLILRSHGVPYDPVSSLTRFLPAPARPSADTRRRIVEDPLLTSLVREAVRSPSTADRTAVHARIQAHIDREATVVPLYVPDRLAIVRRDLPAPRLEHDVYRVDVESLLGLDRGLRAEPGAESP